MSDIDILIEEQRLEDALCILNGMGYMYTPRCEYRFSLPNVWFHLCRLEAGHLPALENPGLFRIELHIGFLYRRRAWNKAKEDVWKNPRAIAHDDTWINCLPPEQAVIHAAVHYAKHLAQGYIGLRWLLDGARMALKPEPLDWNLVWKLARRWGVTGDVHAFFSHAYAKPLKLSLMFLWTSHRRKLRSERRPRWKDFEQRQRRR